MAAVIGDPVRHSLSPAIMNAAFAAAGLDWVFVALEVAAGQGVEAVRAMRSLHLMGLSVTTPHKADVAAAVDSVTPGASALGGVNCVWWEGDRLVGDSTDGDGCCDALEADDVPLAGARVAVLGAGPAARSIVAALDRRGVSEIVIVNRTVERAAKAAALAPRSARIGLAEEISQVDLVINATSVGMGVSGGIAVDPRFIRSGQVVLDIVYHPLLTPFLAAASERGARTLDGIGMLVGQAAIAFSHWTRMEAPILVMRAAALAGLPAR